MIFHIATQHDWDLRAHQDDYVPSAFSAERFIHLSTDSQVPGVLQRYYKGREDLLLLTVDETKLAGELKYEPATGGELFPHLFGPINKSAIVKIEPIEKVR
ncbi:MAG: DUF952 domain-containing protein [Flammeovirgaceae bacterium]